MKGKFIVSAAITGAVHVPSMSPYLPVTPKQIADDAFRAHKAGAAVVHIHVRNPVDGEPSSEINLFREVITRISSRCNAVICLSTGGGMGMTTEERVAQISVFKPELGSFNMGSINFAFHDVLDNFKSFKYDWEREYLRKSESFIFPNTFETLQEFCGIFRRNRTKPELEVYDVGMVNNIAYLLQKGLLKRPVYIQFVLGILGGIPASVDNLVILHGTAREIIGDFNWSVCAAGHHQLPLCAAALAMGGNVRVGLEDSLYEGKGILAKSSANQVRRIVRIGRELSMEPASPDEAREILGLKGLGAVTY